MSPEEELRREIKDLRSEIRDLKEFVKALYSMITDEDEEYAGSDAGGAEVGRYNT